jgi:hypothetical protein
MTNIKRLNCVAKTNQRAINLLQLFRDHGFCVRYQRLLQSVKRAPSPQPCRNLYSAIAAIACWITCPVSTALSYGKGRNGQLLNGRPPSLVVVTIRLAAISTAPGRIKKIHTEANQPTYSLPGRSRKSAVGPPVPGLALVKVQRAGPLLTQSRHFIYVEVSVFGSAQDERVLGIEDSPHSRWTMMTTTTPPRRSLPKRISEDDVFLRAWTSPAGDQGLP